MRHHVIPRFYLKGFADPDVPDGQHPYVWLYSFDKRLWRKRGVRNVATAAGYYKWVDDAGRDRYDTEHALAMIEGKAAHVLRRKVTAQRPLTPEDRLFLGIFIMHMYMRVPAQHRLVHEVACRRGTEVLRQRLREWQENPQLFEEARRKQEHDGGKTFADLTLDDLKPESFRARPDRSGAIAASLMMAFELAPILCSMEWHFLVSDPPSYFVTSDHPFYMADPSSRQVLDGTGLLMRGVEVTLPLTRNLALLACWGREGSKWIRISPGDVATTNQRSVLAAERFVAAPKPDVPLGGYLEAGADRVARQHREAMDKEFPEFRM